MPKTLTVTVSVPLPDDHFEAADIMAAVKAPLETFKSALPDSAKVTAAVVAERGERKARKARVTTVARGDLDRHQALPKSAAE